MIVLDASAVIEVLMKSAIGIVLDGGYTPRAGARTSSVDIEMTNALRRQCTLGNLAQVRAWQAVEDFRKMRILRHRHTTYLARIWELRDNFTSL